MMTMTAEQLNLDLPRRTALGRADFLVSDANMLALAMLDGWQDWQLPRGCSLSWQRPSQLMWPTTSVMVLCWR